MPDEVIKSIERKVLNFLHDWKYASIVDENIQFAVSAYCKFHTGLCVFFEGDVSTEWCGIAALTHNIANNIMHGIFGKTTYDNSCAFACKFFTDGFANACSASGNNSD